MIHAVWGTKNHAPYLTENIREKVLMHIKNNASVKQIYIDTINCHNDHVHCLVGLNADMTIAKVLQLLKGESSFWINREKLIPTKFEGADEYYAASVCESLIER